MDTNKKKNILIASDHGGWEWKNILLDYLKQENIDVEDIGPFHYDPDDDYPDYANILLQKVSRGEASRGILLCRSGIGMSIMANRYHFIRAALALDEDYAKKSREHNNANILVTGGDKTSSGHLCSLVKTWLETPFSQEKRHLRRLKKIENYTYDDMNPVRAIDPEIATFLDEEAQRQEEVLELIASENIVSPAVRTAQGSSLTNKYAEGYPGKRYYDGCECVDKVEKIAIERAKTLFGAEGVNVQPHSGSQANMAVYFALLNPGDTILAMSLAHGGHLTHGAKVNFSGRLFTIIGYGVDKETEKIDYDDVKKLALEHRPKMILAGASAYSRYIDFSQLRQIADSIGAYLVVDMAHIAGLVAAGVHPSPIPMADVVTTTTHKTLRGPRGGLIFCKEAYQKKINSQIFPGIQGGPLMHVIAAKAVCLKEAMTKEFVSYQKQVVKNAQCLANQLAEKGFRIVSGGTDNHLLLVDLRPLGTTGNKAAHALDRAGITVNKNMIPFDPEKPFVTSGLRIGTPAVTTRGMQETEMILIGEWIYRIVRNPENEQIQRSIRDEVIALTKKFPLYQN